MAVKTAFFKTKDLQECLNKVEQRRISKANGCYVKMGFTLFTDSEGGSHMTLGSMPMREPVPASWTRTYSGSAKAMHANKLGFGFVEVYMQAKS